MAKVSPIQSDFSGGEVSPLFQGRVESDRYKQSLDTCLNYLPTIQGGITRRPGSRFAAEVKDSSKATRIISFRFSTEQAYIIELGDQYARFYKDNAQITESAKNITGITQANPAVVTSNAHGFSNGDEVFISGVGGMTEVNGRNFLVAGVTANTFQLHYLNGSNVNSSAFGAYTSGGTAERVYTVSTPYLEADIFDLRFTQSADVLYIVHPSYAPRKLTRTAHTSWTLTSIAFNDGPYLPLENPTGITLTPSATSGAITITSSAAGFFHSSDVGRVVRFGYNSIQWVWARITGYVSDTVVNATVEGNAFPATTASTTWRLGLFYVDNYPGSVVFHEDRLCFGGTPSNPQRVDGSRTGEYEEFGPTEEDGSVLTSNAISYSISAGEVNASQWLTSDEKGLLTGTTGSEFVIRPSSLGEALSPVNAAAKKATSFGSAHVGAIQVGKATLYTQRSGRKLREFIYFYDVDGFQSNDLTLLAEHMLSSGMKEMVYQSEPQPIIWCVRNDGVLAAMTYARDPDTLKVGWSRHILGGYGDAANGPAVVESAAVIPSADESYDELWIVAKRRINGHTVRYVEYFASLFNTTIEQEDAVFVDCSLSYDVPVTISNATQANPVVVTATAHGFNNGDTVIISAIEGMTELNGNIYTVANKTANTFQLLGTDGSAFRAYVSGGEVRKRVSTVSGLWHLEGETVAILGDGAVQPDRTVTNGTITLQNPAAVIQIGFNYNSDLKLLRIEAGAADGTALGKTRRINRVGALLHRTLGMKMGPSFENLTPVTFRSAADAMGHAPELYSGLISENFEAGYDFENQICIRQNQPLPGTILAIAPQMTTQDR